MASRRAGTSDQLSPHFHRREFRCKGHGLRGHRAHETIVAPALVRALERLRALAGGRPLTIVSGHRCDWYNRRVGGAARSRHVVGDAADIVHGAATLAQAERAGFRGIGTLRGLPLHVDTRPRRARWTYD